MRRRLGGRPYEFRAAGLGATILLDPEPVCPVCGARGVFLVYGDPGPMHLHLMETGRALPGGHDETPSAPTHGCRKGHRWLDKASAEYAERLARAGFAQPTPPVPPPSPLAYKTSPRAASTPPQTRGPHGRLPTKNIPRRRLTTFDDWVP